MTWTRLVPCLAVLAVVSGCKETADCDNIGTPEIAMLTEVVAGENGRSVVTTELRVGGAQSNTFCILGSGDELVASADGQERTMAAVDDGVYETTFSLAEEDTEFEVRLLRDVDDDSLGNVGTMPAPFDIVSDLGETWSRADDDVEIAWDPSGTSDEMDISISDDIGGCLRFDEDDDIGGDPGLYVVEAGTLESSGNAPETCDLDVTLSRTRRGDVDPELDRESRFVLKQIRTASFTSAP